MRQRNKKYSKSMNPDGNFPEEHYPESLKHRLPRRRLFSVLKCAAAPGCTGPRRDAYQMDDHETTTMQPSPQRHDQEQQQDEAFGQDDFPLLSRSGLDFPEATISFESHLDQSVETNLPNVFSSKWEENVGQPLRQQQQMLQSTQAESQQRDAAVITPTSKDEEDANVDRPKSPTPVLLFVEANEGNDIAIIPPSPPPLPKRRCDSMSVSVKSTSDTSHVSELDNLLTSMDTPPQVLNLVRRDSVSVKSETSHVSELDNILTSMELPSDYPPTELFLSADCMDGDDQDYEYDFSVPEFESDTPATATDAAPEPIHTRTIQSVPSNEEIMEAAMTRRLQLEREITLEYEQQGRSVEVPHVSIQHLMQRFDKLSKFVEEDENKNVKAQGTSIPPGSSIPPSAASLASSITTTIDFFFGVHPASINPDWSPPGPTLEPVPPSIQPSQSAASAQSAPHPFFWRSYPPPPPPPPRQPPPPPPPRQPNNRPLSEERVILNPPAHLHTTPPTSLSSSVVVLTPSNRCYNNPKTSVTSSPALTISSTSSDGQPTARSPTRQFKSLPSQQRIKPTVTAFSHDASSSIKEEGVPGISSCNSETSSQARHTRWTLKNAKWEKESVDE